MQSMKTLFVTVNLMAVCVVMLVQTQHISKVLQTKYYLRFTIVEAELSIVFEI